MAVHDGTRTTLHRSPHGHARPNRPRTRLASALLIAGALAQPALADPLAVPQGGTGAASLMGVLKGNGTSPFTTATAGTDYLAPTGS